MNTILAESTIDLHRDIALHEKELLAQPQVECPVHHFFSPGLYVREVFMPAGAFVVGHHHRHDHLNIMLKGRLVLFNEDGTTTELTAPFMYTSRTGRKVAVILEDVVWQNIFPTAETDIEKLEEIFFDKGAVWYENEMSRHEAASLLHEADRDDYLKALAEHGFTDEDEQARAISERTEDLIDLPFGGYKVKLGVSPIEGKGLFATASITAGEVIAPVRIGGKQTFAGRYTNHSLRPSARMELRENGDIDLVAAKDIEGCKGGFDGEEVTIDYRQALSLQFKSIKEKIS